MSFESQTAPARECLRLETTQDRRPQARSGSSMEDISPLRKNAQNRPDPLEEPNKHPYTIADRTCTASTAPISPAQGRVGHVPYMRHQRGDGDPLPPTLSDMETSPRSASTSSPCVQDTPSNPPQQPRSSPDSIRLHQGNRPLRGRDGTTEPERVPSSTGTGIAYRVQYDTRILQALLPSPFFRIPLPILLPPSA